MDETISVTSAGGVELDYEVAGLGGRSFAFIIDFHIRVILVLVWLISMSYLVFQTLDSSVISEMIDDSETQALLFVFVVLLPAMVIFFLYHPILELLMGGRTPGKRMAGVRVIGKDGHTATAGAILVRNVFRLIDSFPFIFYLLGIMVAMFNRKKLRLGDLAAGTVLIYEEKTDKRGIAQLIAGEQTSFLSTRQRELAIELSERWKQLQSVTRIELASRLLEQLGRETYPEEKRTRREKLLLAEVQQVISGDQGADSHG